MTDDQKKPDILTPKPPASAEQDSEKRKGPDRRQRAAVFDEQGYVHTSTYSGPDRRAHQRRQEQKAKIERKKFLNRTVMTASVFTVIIGYAVAVLLAPELAQLRKKEIQHKMVEKAQGPKPAAPPSKPVSIGGQLNHAIETVEDKAQSVTGTMGTTASGDEHAFNVTGLNNVPGAAQILGAVAAFNRLVTSSEGQASASAAIDTIKSALFVADGDPQQTMMALDNARRKDPSVAAVLGQLNTTDLKAAALLLTLNEFRANVGSQRAFETDLAVLKKYAGEDPELQKSLNNLAPYAKSGVLSRQGLQNTLEASAGDIVMAKMRGEDASAKERVMARFGKLVKVRRVDDVTGDTPDAIVARAQKMLNAGDVQSAVAELKKLDGPSAQAASPFISQAEGTMAAEEASGLMTDQVMQELSDTLGTSLKGLFQPGPASLYVSPSASKPKAGAGGTYLAP